MFQLNLFTGISTYGNFGEKHSRKTDKILNIAKSLKNKGINLHEPQKESIYLKN